MDDPVPQRGGRRADASGVRRDLALGIVAMCVGGGQALAALVRRA